jgi:phosphoglycolate phosphatase
VNQQLRFDIGNVVCRTPSRSKAAQPSLERPQKITRSRRGATILPTTSVVFDFDGTLIDSKPGIIKCLRKVGELHGLDPKNINDSVIGPPAGVTINQLMPDHDIEARVRFLKAFRDCYASEGWSDCSLYAGVPGLLENLRSSGAKTFICTSKREDLTLKLLNHFHLRSYFKSVAADKEELRSHEKKHLLASLIETEGIDSSRGYMVGDSKYDIEAARANDMNAISVLYGYGNKDDIVESKPDALCPTPKSIYQFLQSIGAVEE